MLEAALEQAVVRQTRLLGVPSLKLNVAGQTGYPDRLFWVPGGRPLLIEFKRPGEVPTPKQLYIHRLLRDLGYRVEVHDDILAAVRSLRHAVKCSVQLGKTRVRKLDVATKTRAQAPSSRRGGR